MARPDLNLLFVLDALLAEGHVARAARRLGLSASAMSRALARLREATGDPLLVAAGRGMVPSPRALALRERIGPLLDEAQAALRPVEAPDLALLQRTFTLRATDGFVESFGAALLVRVEAAAPGVRLRFVPKLDKDSAALRDGSADLETGVVGRATGLELRAQALFDDRFVGVVHPGHALVAGGAPDAAAYAAAGHVRVSRRAGVPHPVDDALAALGLAARVATTVGGYAAALALVRAGDWVATVPERQTAGLRAGLAAFALPLALPALTVSLLWHPRMDGDAAHRWLRGVLREVCAARDGAAG